MARADQQQERKIIHADGVSEGRRLQQLDDAGREKDTRRYRSERDRALEEVASLRVQLEELQAKFMSLPSSSGGNERMGSPPGLLNGKTTPPAVQEENNTSPRDSWGSVSLVSQAESPTSTIAGQARSQTLVYAAVAASAATTTRAQQQTPYSASPTNREATGSTAPSDTFQDVVRKKRSAPKAIHQVEKLMKSAHQPGNTAALLRVKALCRQAHETPRAQKTDVQRYLLAKWTNPTWDGDGVESTSVRAASLPTPRLEDPIEDHIAYFARHRESMPRGIPQDARGSVLRLYFQAHQIVGLLRPEKTLGSEKPPNGNGSRTQFKLLAARFFSDPTAYRRFLERKGISVAPVKNYKPYDSPLEGTTIEDVASHFAACGVSLEDAEDKLNMWAKEYILAMAEGSTGYVGF